MSKVSLTQTILNVISEEDISKLTVAELKILLKEMGLPLTGKKTDLINRIKQRIQSKITVAELKILLKEMGLPLTGKKTDLINRIKQRIQKLESKKSELKSELENTGNAWSESQPSWNDWGIYWLKFFFIPPIFWVPLMFYESHTAPDWAYYSWLISAFVGLYFLRNTPWSNEHMKLEKKWFAMNRWDSPIQQELKTIDKALKFIKEKLSGAVKPLLITTTYSSSSYTRTRKSSSKPKKKHWLYDSPRYRQIHGSKHSSDGSDVGDSGSGLGDTGGGDDG